MGNFNVTGMLAGLCLLAMQFSFAQSAAPDWSDAGIAAIDDYYASLDSGALVVWHHGEPVLSRGEASRKYNVASVRKALLNSLYGVASDRGWLRLDQTLAELGIDDTDPPLTMQEKTATIEDLLRSRSSIVHRSLYEAGWWELMPQRDEFKPGEHWIYNNWDFNALGTIFEQQSGRRIHKAFDEFIAKPIGMEDFAPGDVEYETRNNLAERMRGNKSDHRLYLFKMSARDLARFGQLYLNRGQWNGQQILSPEWIARSMDGTLTEFGTGRFNTLYGYLWWIERGELGRFRADGVSEAWVATGNRGHYIYIAPRCDLVIAHTAPTPGGAGAFSQITRRFFGSDGIEDEQFAHLVELIVAGNKGLRC